jgi:hypothetical protein
VPEDGKALADYWAPEVKEMMDTYRDSNAPLPAMPLTFFGVTDPEVAKFVEPRLTAQPWRTCYQPVKALKVRPAIPISYIVCTGWGETYFTARLAEMKEDPGVWTTTLDANHLCMLTAAEDTVAALSHQPTANPDDFLITSMLESRHDDLLRVQWSPRHKAEAIND